MKEIRGDLLEIRSGILCHQVNALGITGGLAGALRRKFPHAFDTYEAVCEIAKEFNEQKDLLGSVDYGYHTDSEFDITIAHIYGQFAPGPNTDLVAVDRALAKLAEYRKHLAEAGTEVPCYCPNQMGCGLGGGDWSKYLPLLVKHVPDIIIVRKYD